MEKRIVYIAYLVLACVIFNFFYGFTDWVSSWQLWDWYLLILLLTIFGLLVIKYKQNQRKLAVEQYAKENERRRIQLNQLLMFEQLNKLNDELFCELLQRFFELQGYDEVEVSQNRNTCGYDLMMWDQGQKIIVKYFKRVPMTEELSMNDEELGFSLGDLVTLNEIRDFYGSMQDYDIQADIAIALSTSDFTEDALQFASRNKMTLMNGYELYQLLLELKDEEDVAAISQEMLIS